MPYLLCFNDDQIIKNTIIKLYSQLLRLQSYNIYPKIQLRRCCLHYLVNIEEPSWA